MSTHTHRTKLAAGECTKEDLCYSLQETVFAMLVRRHTVVGAEC